MTHFVKLALVIALSLAASSAEEPAIFRKLLCKNGATGIHTYRIPALTTSKRGTLLAAYDLRHHSAADLPADIDVGLKRSVDQGETWSASQVVLDFPAADPASKGNGVGDPCLLADLETGELFIFALWSYGNHSWNGSGPGVEKEVSGQLVMAQSTDDGLTWSPPRILTADLKQPTWRLLFQGPGAGVQLRGGQLVIPAQFKDATNVPHSCFIASADHGKTWRISPPAAPTRPPTSESALVELADGSLLLSMRDEAHTGQRLWAQWTWHDDLLRGHWSEPWSGLPDPTCMASLLRHPSGVLLFAHANHATQRQNLTIRFSSGDPHKWSTGRVIDPQGAMYSCLTALSDGRFGLLYESASQAGLVFVRGSLAWVTEAP